MRSAPLGVRVGAVLLALVLLGACKFDPVARRSKPEQQRATPLRLLRTLDTLGKYTLVAESDASTDTPTGIYAWRTDRVCTLPAGYPDVLRSLSRDKDATAKAPQLYLLMAEHVADDAAAALRVVDEQCVKRADFPAIVINTAQAFTSARDQRGLLYARDANQTLYALDPGRFDAALALATEVQQSAPTHSDGSTDIDGIWVLSHDTLNLLTSAGQLLHTRGSAVTEFALSADEKRIAYIDGGQLVEAIAPAFAPRVLVADACSPRYLGTDLAVLSPCADARLMIRYATDTSFTRYPEGVFAAVRSHGVELTYSHDEDNAVTMSAKVGTGKAQPIVPTLLPDTSFALDDGTLIGLTEAGEFGLVSAEKRTFSAIFSSVSRVLAQYRGKSHSYAFLVHHDAVDDLGTLSVLEMPSQQVRTVANDVPSQRRKGFVLEAGRAFPNYPFPSPTIALLADAAESADNSAHFTGSLRAQLLIGGGGADTLANDVTSFVLVASPMPGILYSVDGGDGAGVWYVAL